MYMEQKKKKCEFPNTTRLMSAFDLIKKQTRFERLHSD